MIELPIITQAKLLVEINTDRAWNRVIIALLQGRYMDPEIDLSFLEQFSDLEIVKNFIKEKNNGNKKNRRKLKHAIINIRLHTGKVINQRMFLEGNPIMVSQYADEIKRYKQKLIILALFCSLIGITLSMGLLYFNESLLQNISALLLLIVMCFFSVGTLYLSSKINKMYDTITKIYVMEYFDNK